MTNLRRPAKKVVAFYNGRGTAEQWIKEGKHAVKWTRLSCTTFRANAVRLQLHALAYNLANFLRTLALPKVIADWSLTSLREKVVKIGAKVIAHGRYLILQMAEVAVPRELFGRILDRIARLRPPDPAPCCRSKGATEAAGGRATPGIPPCGAAVRSEGPRKRPGPPWRGHHRALPCRRGENHCRRGHEGGIQAQGRGWAPSIWEIRSRKRP